MVRYGTRKCSLGTTYGVIRIFAIAASLLLNLSGKTFACPCQEIKEAPEPATKLDRLKGVEFTYTTEYADEFNKAVQSAREACQKHLFEPKVAVVSDLDETLFDNREFYKIDPSFNNDQLFEWIGKGRQPVLKPTAEFLSWARQNGFAVFLVTGRPERLRAATIENLVKEHIAYDGLFLREVAQKLPAEQVKAPVREQIEKMGFKIIVNIGDQVSDLTGGYAEDCEKLPNRMYYIR